MVDNRNVYIYVLKHPDNLEIKYVGKTISKLNIRLGKHIANAKGNKHNKHLSNWILKILKDNKKPIIELLEVCNQNNWEEREQYWISYFPNLLNITLGGDGCKGLKHNPLTIAKLKKINKGRKHTQEFKDKLSLRLKGKPLTEDYKLKIGKANKGKKASLETKKKLSLAHKGIVQSDETKRKRSKSIKEWWSKRKSIKDIVSNV